MLLEVQSYIATHGTASVVDLAIRFQTDAETLQPILKKLSQKGRIQMLPVAAKCAGCTACDPLKLVCYQWTADRWTADRR